MITGRGTSAHKVAKRRIFGAHAQKEAREARVHLGRVEVGWRRRHRHGRRHQPGGDAVARHAEPVDKGAQLVRARQCGCVLAAARDADGGVADARLVAEAEGASEDGGHGGGGCLRDEGDAGVDAAQAPLPPVLQALSAAEIAALGAAGAELRCLLRIKVEDDSDMQTARQALAECGYFLLLLREEAPKRRLSEQALLEKCDLGEG